MTDQDTAAAVGTTRAASDGQTRSGSRGLALRQPQGLSVGMELEYRGDPEKVDHTEMEIVGMAVEDDTVVLSFPGDDQDTPAPMGRFWSLFPNWEVVE